MGKVRVVGSANLDFVFRVPRFVRVGETLLGAEFQSHPGGKGANQAYAIGKLGGDVQFVGCVGDDPYGEGLRQNLASAGVDVMGRDETRSWWPPARTCTLRRTRSAGRWENRPRSRSHNLKSPLRAL